MTFGVSSHIHCARLLTQGDQGTSRIRSRHADQLVGFGIRQRNKQNSTHESENCRVGSDSQCEGEHGNRGEYRRFTQGARAEVHIGKKTLNRRPLPYLAAVFFGQGYVPELAAGSGGGILS